MNSSPSAEGHPGVLIDAHGRRIDYLRVSVTDRCNLRCVYCMPPEGITWQPRDTILSYEEILSVVRAAAALGISKVRLTGGEPLVRPELINLVRGIAGVPGIDDLSLTTNAMLLSELAQPLADAGLRRINVSLDTLDPAKFRRLTRRGDIERVWAGIRAAEAAGLTPIKINSVIIKGINDDELGAMAGLTLEHPWHVRFIELMPIGNAEDWGSGFPVQAQRQLSVQDMQERLRELGLAPAAAPPLGSGPARTFTIRGGIGTVGFISPIGEHFCASCNRLRLTADGRLRPCLLSEREIPVRNALRSAQAGEEAEISALIRRAAALKPSGHTLQLPDAIAPQNRTMCQIGG